MSAAIALEAALWLLTAGCGGYFLFAIVSVLAYRPRIAVPVDRRADVTVLRPLCGAEPGLEVGLRSLLSQDVNDDAVRFVFGVASLYDPALAVARRVAADHPSRRVEFVANGSVHGSNPKVSNLINMSAAGLDDVVVITDSDVILPPGSLNALIDAVAPDDVGAATALSRGRPAARGSLSQWMGCLYLDGWFLPTALLHARLAPASVCYGQLTAIKRDVLPGGGFGAIANALADDTELGHLTRRAGRKIVFAPHVVEICVSDVGFKALFTHELRWAKTIRALQPRGYVASIFMHPGPLPLLLPLVHPALGSWAPAVLLAVLRWLLVSITHHRLGRAAGTPPVDPLSLWLREQFYFGVWLAGFHGRKITWRGRDLRVGPNATVAAVAATRPLLTDLGLSSHVSAEP